MDHINQVTSDATAMQTSPVTSIPFHVSKLSSYIRVETQDEWEAFFNKIG